MPDTNLTEKDKQVFGIIAQVFVALLFIGIPLVAIGYFFPKSLPVVFIVAGLILFSIPGLFHRDPKQLGKPLAAFAYRCYQLIQDEDPKMSEKISLAKFQMLFWTIILSTSFTWLLLEKGTAPEIPNAWLVLMGISNGTYVLAKLAKTAKEKRREAEKSDKTSPQS